MKAAQVALIHETLPWLESVVPRVEVRDLEHGAVLCAPFRPGEPPLPQLLDGNSDGFFRSIREVLRTLSPAYAARRSAAVHPQAEYCDRVDRRVEYFTSFAPDLVRGPVPCSDDLPRLATRLRQIAHADHLLPTHRYFPVHGDLNLFNVLVTGRGSNRLTLVDQRGTLDDWDPVYDLGKMLLSLLLQGPLELGRVAVMWRGAPTPDQVVVHADTPTLTAQAAGILAFRMAVAEWDFGEELESEVERRWRRVVFAAAAHAVAEAACRVSVGRSIPGRGPQEIEKAMAYLWLAGSLVGRLESGGPLDVTLPAARCTTWA